MSERRPNPLDPYPESRPQQGSGDELSYPPELGTDAIAILEGRTFMFSDALGDVPPGSTGGLLHDDTRFLSRWELTIDGRPLAPLKSRVVDYYSAAFFLTNPELPGLRANSLTVRRSRFVGGGVHEQIAVSNPTPEPLRFQMRLATGADFGDLFEVKSAVRDRSALIDVEHDPDERLLHYHYEVPGFLAETDVRVARSGVQHDLERTDEAEDAPPRVEGDDLVWELELEPRHHLVTTLVVTVRINDDRLEPMHDDFGDQQKLSEGALTDWLAEVPRFESDDVVVMDVLEKSVVDLAALRIEGEIDGERYYRPPASRGS